MVQLGDPSGLIDVIYDACVGASTWTQAVRALEGPLGGPVAIFAQRDRPTEVIALCSTADETRARQYVENLWQEDVAMRVIRSGRSDRIIFDGQLVSDRERARSPFYGGYLGATGAHRGLYVPVLRDGETSYVLSAMRMRSHGDFGTGDATFAETLRPHFARALRTFVKLRQAKLTEMAASQALGQSGVGIIFASADARLRFATPEAERELQGRGLTVVHGRLHALRPQATAKLHAAIAAAARPLSATAHDVQVPMPGEEGERTLVVTPVRQGVASILEEPMAMIAIGRSDAAAVDGQRLRRALGLTPAESQLLGALVQGERIGDYALRSGIRLTTAKTQLSSIFRKTGERRQADLIRRALSDPMLRAHLA